MIEDNIYITNLTINRYDVMQCYTFFRISKEQGGFNKTQIQYFNSQA